MKTRATSRSMPSAMGATAALTFGSPAVLAIAGATAASSYAWKMALAGPYMAMRFGKGGAGDLVKSATKQAEAAVDATIKAAQEAAEAVAEVTETAVEASTEVAHEMADAVLENVEVALAPEPAIEEAPVEEAPAVEDAAPTVEAAPEEAQAEVTAAMVQPKALEAPRGGQSDDLTAIKGIGPKLAEKLGEMGIYHYDQIAAWTEAEVAWMDENLGRPTGRASRNNWVAEAAGLA